MFVLLGVHTGGIGVRTLHLKLHRALLAFAALICTEQIFLPGGALKHIADTGLLVVAALFAVYLVTLRLARTDGRR